MKYKRLSNEELQALEKEFVNYLAAAQITANDWEQLKKEDLHKAEELIDVFSDMVYEKVLSNINYLEHRDKKTLNIFNCGENSMVVIGLRVKENSAIDLTAKDVLSMWDESKNDSVNVVTSENRYTKERGMAVFELLQNGCLITDDKLFNLLKGMVSSTT